MDIHIDHTMAKTNHKRASKAKATPKPIPDNQPKPLIQALDQEIVKTMLMHKNRLIDSYLNTHEDVKQCIIGACDHYKVGQAVRKMIMHIESDGRRHVSIEEVDPYDVCGYTMSTLAHFIEYDMFRQFITEEEEEPTPRSEQHEEPTTITEEAEEDDKSSLGFSESSSVMVDKWCCCESDYTCTSCAE